MNTPIPARRRGGPDPRAVLGLSVLLGGALIWAFAFSGGFSGVFGGGSSRTIKADFASVQSVVKNDPVRIKGVQVGTVAEVTHDDRTHGGTVTFRLDHDAGPVYADAGATILWRTALGANDAIALDPGTRAAGPLGSAAIPRRHTASQVELDEITGALGGGAQQGIRSSLQQLGPAFSDHAALAQGLTTLARVAPGVRRGLGALRGQVRDRDLQALVREAGRASQALAVGTGAGVTRRFVASAATTLSAMAASSSDVSRSVADLARVLPHAGATLPQVQATLDRLDPLVATLTVAAPHVAPALRDLRPPVVHARALLADAAPLLRRLRPAARSLAGAAAAGSPVLDGLEPSLRRLDERILPDLAQDTPETRGHPAYTMLGSALGGLGPMSHSFDRDGPQVNLTAGLEEPQGATVLPCTEDFSGTPFLVCASLSEALKTAFGAGTSLLQKIGPPAGGAAAKLLAGFAGQARADARRLDDVRRRLSARDPQVARSIFRSHEGGGR